MVDGVISVETALKDYGVAVSAKGVIDVEATTMARARQSQKDGTKLNAGTDG